MTIKALVFGTIVIFATQADVRGELIALHILHREPFAAEKSFGDTGPYEKIVGIAEFEVDPKNPRNRAVVDLDLAPKNTSGKVECRADFCILAPKDYSKGNGAIFYDVNNRGNKLALRFFNYGGGGNDPKTAADAGDGFLMRRGYTIVWSGWNGEALPGNHRLLLHAPIARQKDGKPIRGLVRFEIVTDKPAESQPLSRREGHGSYKVTEKGEKEGRLTYRLHETDPRIPIPREQWSLERKPIPTVAEGVPGNFGQIRLKLKAGFKPGYIYELIAECEDPNVLGLGYIGVRDLISFLKYDTTDHNPFRQAGKSTLTRAYGFGVSQSGRFLRNFLYLDFNADEKNRKVFDGLMPHVAGGGLGFFNFRFAQPTRHNGQHEEHLYPGDRFPFTYGTEWQTYLRESDGAPVQTFAYDGILNRTSRDNPKLLPKIIHTQTAAEYWHRSGSLVHTDPLGTKDVEIPPSVRVFAFGGTQHGPASDPPGRGSARNLNNPADYRPFLRALLDALDAWVTKGTEPPASIYPRIADGTLVNWHQKSTGFPNLPGVQYPNVIQRPPFLNYGPEFGSDGIVSVEPPEIVGHYVVKVPKSDTDGNDLGTLLPPEVAVPLATYTGWNLRRKEVGAEGMLASLTGSYIPFAKNKAERLNTGDPRKSIAERYSGFSDYRQRFAAQCANLVKQRLMLPEDEDRLVRARDKVSSAFQILGK